MQYALPGKSAYDDWRACESRAFSPTPRQQVAIDAVRAALAAGCFYTTEVRAFCAKHLNISPEIDAAKSERVEGGDFGYDLFYARNYIRAQELFAKEDAARAEMKLQPGQKLPPLMFNDFKLNRAVVVESVSETGLTVSLTGKRGAQSVRWPSVTPLQVKNAIDRAAERAARRAAA